MKKIVFGITSLNSGGAERVLVDIVNKLCRKYDITIFTLYGNGIFKKELDKRVKVISMYDCSYDQLSFFQKKVLSLRLVIPFWRKRIYKKYIANKFDVSIAFLEGPMTWIMSSCNSRNIAWIHNDIESVFGKSISASYKQKMNNASYLKYDELVFVSNDNLEKFNKIFPENRVSKRVIYNYLDVDKVLEKAKDGKDLEIDKSKYSFVQVSRLVPQKAILRLIDVHKRLIDEGYDYNIYIIGDGCLKNEIIDRIKKYKLEKSFHLLGQKENPYPYMKEANVFMLTSFYEGYPMVLLEAKALNKFIMITDSAARETLNNYCNSLIVMNSEEGIYDGMKRLLDKKIDINDSKDKSDNKVLNDIISLIEGD